MLCCFSLSLYGGVGLSINGQVITGRHHIAGEIKYLIDGTKKRQSDVPLSITPDDILDVVVFTLRTIIAMVDPDELVLCCRYIPDIERIQNRLIEIFPPNCIPPIVQISEEKMLDYMSLGALQAANCVIPTP